MSSMNNSIIQGTQYSQEKQDMANVGKEILETNMFFKDLAELMKNAQFRRFYNEYFTDWSDIQVMIFYMKLYAMVESEYSLRYCREIDNELVVYVMHNIMSAKMTRKIALNLFKNYKDGDDMAVLRPMLEFTGQIEEIGEIEELEL
jgi:hypothetical protein